MRTLVFLAVLSCAGRLSAQEIPRKERVAAPAFDLHQVGGPLLGGAKNFARATPADFGARIAVLSFFYPGCGPCSMTHTRMRELARQFREDDVAILEVSADTSVARIKEWLGTQGGAVLPVYRLPDDLAKALTLRTVPRIVIIDIRGNIAYDGSAPKIVYDSLPPILARLKCENQFLRCS